MTQGTLWKWVQISFKIEMIASFLWDVSPSKIRSYSHKASPTYLPKHELNKDDTKGHAKLDGEKSVGSHSYPQKNVGNYRKPITREVVFLREKHTNLLFSACNHT